jgi:hypothetical protein
MVSGISRYDGARTLRLFIDGRDSASRLGADLNTSAVSTKATVNVDALIPL